MVNALVIDIVDDGFFVADATRKCAVLLTPTLKTWKKSFLLRPLATALLNVAVMNRYMCSLVSLGIVIFRPSVLITM